MTTTFRPVHRGTPQAPESGSDLAARLQVLDNLVEISTGRIEQTDQDLLDDAVDLLGRAGQRLRLSPNHTVVALAGGTGGGKSSLFNTVCGLNLSPVGVRRPTTATTHGCVWGLDGAGPLLDWLGVDKRQRYARARTSSRDRDEVSLQGLVLLDLPDHDSVRSGHSVEVARYVEVADLLVWVVDPQKYADAALHRRFITPLAGHAGVTVVVLNQIDLLSPTEAKECVTDLYELLLNEGLREPHVITTSTTTGAGIDGFVGILADMVAARAARTERLAADVDKLAQRFQARCGPHEPASTVAEQRISALTEALTDAAGVPAVAESMQSAYELRASDYVGWPVASAVGYFRRDPLRRMRLSELREELQGAFTGPAGAQQPDIDNALAAVTEGTTEGLPTPWPTSVRRAVRSQAHELSGELSKALSAVVPEFNQLPVWWWVLRVWQATLAVVAVVTVGWLIVLGAYGVMDDAQPPAAFLGNTDLVPYVALILVCMLGMGALTASAGRNLVALSAVRHGELMQERMRERITEVAREKVLEPAERELGVYALFRRLVGQLTRYR